MLTAAILFGGGKDARMEFALRPKRTFIIMGFVWSALVLIYGITQYCHVRLHMEDTRHLVKFFDLDGKANIPQTFQAIGLLAIAFFLFGIARHNRAQNNPLTIYWKVLAWIFVFLTFDGICGIHNQMHAFHAKNDEEQRKQGVFFFSWTLAYMGLMLPVGIWYLNFLFKLPRTLAIEILVAGVIYVMGAMGMEMVYGWFRAHYGHVRGSTVAILTTIEESMETLGEMLMLYTLLKHMADQKIRVMVAAVKETAVQTNEAVVVDGSVLAK
jgi:hypothetical protein